MSEVSDKVKALAKASFNLKGFSHGVIDEILEEALKKVVADSSNPFDDILMASVYPVLEAELKKKLDELIDKLYE